MIKSREHKHSRLKKGFSLIEVSIALVIISSLAVVVMMKYTTGREMENKWKAINDLKKIKTAINTYVTANGYYPCPADRDMAIENADFGKGRRDAAGNCDARGASTFCFTGAAGSYTLPAADATYDIKHCSNDTDADKALIYRRLSLPAANTVFDHVNYADRPSIYEGVVPCKDLGLPQDCMFDPQGNRYGYAVVAGLARAGSATVAKACDVFYVPDGRSPHAPFRPSDPGPPTAGQLHLPGGNRETPLNSYFKVPTLTKIKMLKDYNGAQPLNFAYTDYRKHIPAPDFTLIYYGKSGIGSFTKGGKQITATQSIASGGYIGDSVFQEVNNNLRTPFDDYYYMPENPPEPGVVFDQVLIFGLNNTDTNHPRQKVCVRCGDCTLAPAAPDANRIVSFTCNGCTGSGGIRPVCTVLDTLSTACD
jgi:prepilin-type N-terminal cleavage/methylation domain-containing protein